MVEHKVLRLRMALLWARAGSVGVERQARCHFGRSRVHPLRHGAHALHVETGKEELVGGVYVDELIVTGALVEDVDGFKREMTACF